MSRHVTRRRRCRIGRNDCANPDSASRAPPSPSRRAPARGENGERTAWDRRSRIGKRARHRESAGGCEQSPASTRSAALESPCRSARSTSIRASAAPPWPFWREPAPPRSGGVLAGEPPARRRTAAAASSRFGARAIRPYARRAPGSSLHTPSASRAGRASGSLKANASRAAAESPAAGSACARRSRPRAPRGPAGRQQAECHRRVARDASLAQAQPRVDGGEARRPRRA